MSQLGRQRRKKPKKIQLKTSSPDVPGRLSHKGQADTPEKTRRLHQGGVGERQTITASVQIEIWHDIRHQDLAQELPKMGDEDQFQSRKRYIAGDVERDDQERERKQQRQTGYILGRIGNG